jgi:uncharacterized lipoprotein YajG
MKIIIRYVLSILASILFLCGCYTQHKIEADTTHKVELEVKPMHITIDVNVKVDRALDDFFGDLDKQDKTMNGDKK